MTGPPLARSDTKTLFTPVFFQSSLDSTSLSSLSQDPSASAYLGQLSRAHVALSQVPELPPSRPGSPVGTQLRTDAIKAKVMVALENANHDSSNGQWAELSRILHLTATRGRQGRWLNTSVEKPAEPRSKPKDGWLNASTEREWSTWEKKREAEVATLIKVQKWSKDVARKTPTKKVVKARATPAIVMGTSQVSAKGAAPVPAKAPAQPQVSVKARKSSPKRQAPPASSSPKHIADITETFLPPSFPSDLVTSTPKGARNTSGSSRRKPSPIQGAPSSSPIDLYDKTPNFLSSPVTTRKRQRSPSPDRPNKHIRTDSAPSPAEPPPSTTSPSRPPTRYLSPSSVRPSSTVQMRNPSTPPERPIPTLLELLASDKKAKKLSPKRRKSAPKASSSKLSPFPSTSMVAPMEIEVELPPPVPSPAKSMSSIAQDSDSDEEMPDFTNEATFDPPFTSTQQNQFGYNSQVDVEANLNNIDRFLADDIDVDYGAWLKTTPEREEEEE
ncbi:hypothetical protein C8J56DRAFT_1164075 [Mycena floridula]|nr:hypothetical protein C8J56DRAFT_1164075 [Mycena floridula]